MAFRISILILFICIATVTTGTAQTFPGGLIIDHNSVRDFDKIPPIYLEAAKGLTVHYGHESHGNQILQGLAAFYAADPKYKVLIQFESEPNLPPQADPPALRIYHDSMNPAAYWSTASGMQRTRNAAATKLFSISLWSWCGQQSDNSTATVNTYLGNLNQLESEFTNMRFVLMTGHTDGRDTPATPGTLKYNNELVREYARDHNKIVFDFADIESWDPAGNYYPNTGDPDGACNWCAQWCANHLADCQNLTSSCDHTHPYNCKLKAKAFWYMMARLAGWDGETSVTPPAAPAGLRVN